jgi:hypothetical protein
MLRLRGAVWSAVMLLAGSWWAALLVKGFSLPVGERTRGSCRLDFPVGRFVWSSRARRVRAREARPCRDPDGFLGGSPPPVRLRSILRAWLARRNKLGSRVSRRNSGPSDVPSRPVLVGFSKSRVDARVNPRRGGKLVRFRDEGAPVRLGTLAKTDGVGRLWRLLSERDRASRRVARSGDRRSN